MREEQLAALRVDGDGYHARNHAGIGTIADPAFDRLTLIDEVTPVRSVLELGCTTGFRLEKARTAFGARVVGLEASAAAVAEGRDLYPEVELHAGVAPGDLASFAGEQFDVVIVGHFMYLLPREDLFALAAAVDGLLVAGGHLIVMDFIHPTPLSADYTHHRDLRVFKHDPSAPWLWSPTYALVSRQVYDVSESPTACADPRAWQTVDVVRKLTVEQAYPALPTLPSVHDRADGGGHEPESPA